MLQDCASSRSSAEIFCKNASEELDGSLLLGRAGSYPTAGARVRTAQGRRDDDLPTHRNPREGLGRAPVRAGEGFLSLTAAGQLVAIRAERIEFEIDEIKREVTGIDTQVAGVVRVSAPPWMVNHVLVPSLIRLQEKHTALTVELIAEARNVDVMRREADIAVRMSRPVKEQRAVARRLTTLNFAVYGQAGADPRQLRWINFEFHMAGLPQSAWIANAMEAEGRAQPALLVNDSGTALHAVAAGLGKTVLPCILGDRAAGIVRLGSRRPVLSRDVWLMTHPTLKNLSRIRAVQDWLAAALVAGKARKQA